MSLQFSDLLEVYTMDFNQLSPREKHDFIEHILSDYLQLKKNKKNSEFDKNVIRLYKELLVDLIKKYGH